MKTRLFFVTFAAVAALLFSTTSARAQMSDTEKKAAARAAYQEGVKLQDDGKAGEALARFESAQKLFDAPTHVERRTIDVRDIAGGVNVRVARAQ